MSALREYMSDDTYYYDLVLSFNISSKAFSKTNWPESMGKVQKKIQLAC